jgi:cation transport ATPase
MKQFTFHVTGTHCASCKILIEDILGQQDGIETASVNLKKEVVEVVTSTDQNAANLVDGLSAAISNNDKFCHRTYRVRF